MSFVQPSPSDVHVNRPLTNISVAYMQNETSFIASRVFPTLPVAKQSDLFFVYDRGAFNRDEMVVRAPSTESAGGNYTLGTESYMAQVYGYHKDIADQVRANADAPISLDAEATRFVTGKALLRREVDWVSKYFTAGAPGDTWTFDVDGVASNATAAASFNPRSASANDKLQWNDASSTPIEDIRQGKRYVLEETGFTPNVLTLGKTVYDTLLDHPDIVGRIDRGQTPNGPARASLVTLADLFEVDEVLVMQAIQNTAKEGATSSHSFIGGKHALLSYRPSSPGLMTPSAGYTFVWSGYIGSMDGVRIKRFRMEALESDRIEIAATFDIKRLAKDLGYFFGSIVA